MPRRIDALIFDMDGTLLDSMKPVIAAFRETILEAGGRRYTSAQIVAAFTKGSSDRMLAHLLGRQATDLEHAAYHRRLDEGTVVLRPYQGVEEAIRRVRAEGIHVALFTGADRTSLEILMGRSGLRDYFEVLTSGDEVSLTKPAPDGILLTCERLGLAPPSTAYVGDSGPDMRAARNAGSLAVGAAWGNLWREDHAAEVVVKSPLDLPAALKDAVAGNDVSRARGPAYVGAVRKVRVSPRTRPRQ